MQGRTDETIMAMRSLLGRAKRRLLSPHWWSGTIAGVVVFLVGYLLLHLYNLSNGNLTPQLLGGDASPFHPVMIAAALQPRWGLLGMGFLYGIAGGFLATNQVWSKLIGLSVLLLAVAIHGLIVVAMWVSVQLYGSTLVR